MKSFLQIQDLLNLFYPKLCEACGTALLGNEEVLCTTCLYDLPRLRFHISEENKTYQLLWGRIPFQKASSLFYYQKGSDYAELIHKLKYSDRKNIGIYLGELLAYELLECNFFETIDTILPVPLHRRRKRQRGYNQSEIIAQGIQNKVQIPIDITSIKRHVYTKTQTARSKKNRFENVEDVFSVTNQQCLQNKHVLLVDDVITTGATIEALYDCMSHIPNVKISVVSLAIAI